MTENEAITPPTMAQIRAVLAFLPEIENPSEPFYKCDPEISIFDPYIYSAAVSRFTQALYANNFCQSFDWFAWHDQARAYMEDPARLGAADIATIVKLFTTILRADRFCSGSVAGFLNDGFVLALLKRLATIARYEP